MVKELGCTCITISHRPALMAFHDLVLALDGRHPPLPAHMAAWMQHPLCCDALMVAVAQRLRDNTNRGEGTASGANCKCGPMLSCAQIIWPNAGGRRAALSLSSAKRSRVAHGLIRRA